MSAWILTLGFLSVIALLIVLFIDYMDTYDILGRRKK